MDRETLRKEVQALIEVRDLRKLRDIFIESLPADIADIISSMSAEEKAVVFRILPKELAADAFECLDVDGQKELAAALGDQRFAVILNEMAPDDRTALLEEFPAAVTRQLLMLLSKEERAVALKLLGYPENSVGRLMTPDYIAVKQDMTVAQVLDYIRDHGRDADTMHIIYVLDDKGKLTDDIRIRQVLLSPPDRKISELMKEHFVALHWAQDQETAVQTFKKYYRSALPVIDSQGVMMGIVTADDVLSVAEEEATEDIQKLGGTEALEEPYIKTPLHSLIKKRASWLVILFLSEMLTASAMGYFQDEISKAVVLALFVPLIISSGGNSGSQAATLVIRALAIGEITLKDWWRVMRREIVSGLYLGVLLGAIGFLRIALWSAFVSLYGPHWLLVAVVVMCALVLVVLWGTLAGSMLPLVLKRLGADPATSSAPFIATLVDVTGLVIYFSVAAFFLRGILL